MKRLTFLRTLAGAALTVPVVPALASLAPTRVMEPYRIGFEIVRKSPLSVHLASSAYSVLQEGATLRGTRSDDYWRALRFRCPARHHAITHAYQPENP